MNDSWPTSICSWKTSAILFCEAVCWNKPIDTSLMSFVRVYCVQSFYDVPRKCMRRRIGGISYEIPY